jgi:hypothetical protein
VILWDMRISPSDALKLCRAAVPPQGALLPFRETAKEQPALAVLSFTFPPAAQDFCGNQDLAG